MDKAKIVGWFVGIIVFIYTLQVILPYFLFFFVLVGVWHCWEHLSKK